MFKGERMSLENRKILQETISFDNTGRFALIFDNRGFIAKRAIEGDFDNPSVSIKITSFSYNNKTTFRYTNDFLNTEIWKPQCFTSDYKKKYPNHPIYEKDHEENAFYTYLDSEESKCVSDILAMKKKLCGVNFDDRTEERVIYTPEK
jgi:hypothetical protein